MAVRSRTRGARKAPPRGTTTRNKSRLTLHLTRPPGESFRMAVVGDGFLVDAVNDEIDLLGNVATTALEKANALYAPQDHIHRIRVTVEIKTEPTVTRGRPQNREAGHA
jgi:hypothetical protein